MAHKFALEMDRLADANGRQKAIELVAHLGKIVPDVYVLVAQRAFMQTARQAVTNGTIVGDIERPIRQLVERWDSAFAMELKRLGCPAMTWPLPAGGFPGRMSDRPQKPSQALAVATNRRAEKA